MMVIGLEATYTPTRWLDETQLVKILFVFTHFNYMAPLDPIVRQYARDGHDVRVLVDRARNEKFETRYSFGPGRQPYALDWTPTRGDGLHLLLIPLRELISYVAYLRLRQPTSPLLTERWADLQPFFLRPLIRIAAVRRWLTRDWVWHSLRRLEAMAPISARLKRRLREFAPDAVVAASALMPYSKETDYLRAAKALGIHTVLIIPSWDNLTTKGTLHVIPDWVFVWNEGQVREAAALHAVPVERVFCTGAPKFDAWFEIKATLDREAFCGKVGIDPAKPYLLYLCSSGFIAGDESSFVEQLAERLERHPTGREITLLVRPHPQNLEPWRDGRRDRKNVVVWPKDQESLEQTTTIEDFHHSLLHAIGVIGINTSAFIEASIVDKPCIAITPDRYTYTQMGIPHFHHLLDAGFLELCPGVDECLERVAALLAGEDRKREQRRAFVRDFVRPQGVDIPALRIVSQAIENVAMGRSPGAAREESERRSAIPA
jgi:hypothetical protein